MAQITSPTNPRVKQLVRLQRESAARREAGAFCIESTRELARALEADLVVRELYVCDDMIGALPEAGPAAQRVAVSRSVIEKAAYRENPEGFVAVVEARSTSLDQIDADGPELILIASGLEKPGNVGAILRSADAAGATAVFIDAPDFDLYNPHCVRASTGAVFALPVVRADAAALARWLEDRQVTVIAATPEASLTPYGLRLRGPTAFVVGAEAEGLSDDWRQRADLEVAIPLRSRAADSLNVSNAAAVLLFEAARQRIG